MRNPSNQGKPSQRQAESKSVEDLLLHPKNLEYANKLRAGKTLTYPTKTTLTLNSTPQLVFEIQNHLVAWLKTGDIEQLARLLKDIPQALALPEVWEQVFYLSRLRCLASEEDCDLWGGVAAAPDQETLLPRGVKPAAKDALARLLTAWVQGVLPRYTVEPIKDTKRRGAPKKVDPFEEGDLINDFGELLEKLNQRPAMDCRRKEGETLDAWIERTAKVVQDVHLDRAFWYHNLPLRPGLDMIQGMFTTPASPLPQAEALNIARQAVQKYRVAKDKFIYGLLAYWYCRSSKAVGKVRGIIERAEAEHPDLAPPRRSRKR